MEKKKRKEHEIDMHNSKWRNTNRTISKLLEWHSICRLEWLAKIKVEAQREKWTLLQGRVEWKKNCDFLSFAFPLILLTFPGLAAVVSKMSPLGSFVLNLNEIMLCFPVSHGGNIYLVIKRKKESESESETRTSCCHYLKCWTLIVQCIEASDS